MEQQNHKNAGLSQRRYGIGRCIKYVQLLLIVLLLFLPTLNFTSKSKDLGIETTTGISVFQFLTGNTATQIQIKGGANSGEGVFLGSLLKNVSIDIPKEIFGDELAVGFQIGAIFIGLMIGLVSALAGRSNSKTITRDTQNPMSAHLSNQMYITRVYNTLPRLFEFLEKFLFGAILSTNFFFFLGVYMVDATNLGDFEWSFQFILPIIITIILIVLINGGVLSIVCAKDHALIRSGGLRFEESYEFPTVASDMKAIGLVFRGKFDNSTGSEEAKIEALQKYKALLDQGIITEQEYSKKKDDLLNQKNDKI